MKTEGLVMAVDPGRKKCGLAILDSDGQPVFLQTVQAAYFAETAKNLLEKFTPSIVLLGNGTAAEETLSLLAGVLPGSGMPLEKVDERNTTLLARDLYWQYNPPSGWKKWLPRGLLPLPEAVDGYAALALGRRWLMKNV